MPQRILALDIEDAEVKAVVLETSFRDYRIAGLYHDALTDDGGPVPEQLRRFLERHKLAGDTVVSTLPGRLVSHRVFFLPFRDRKRLNQTIPFELESLVPFGLDDVIVDYQVLHRDRSGTTVLAALVQKQDLEAHLATLSAVGVDPKVVDFAPLSTLNVLRVLGKGIPDTFAFVEVTGRVVNVGLYRNRQLVGVRTLLIHGAGFSSNGTGGNGSVESGHAQAVSAVERSLAIEIRWSLMVINGAPLDEHIPCFVAGTPAWIDALGPFLEREIGVDVRRLDATTLPTVSPEARAALPACTTPLGLALREVAPANTLGLNFRRGEFTYHRGQQEVRRALMRVGALVAVLLALALANVFVSYQLQLNRLAAIQAQVRKVFVATLPNERPVNESAQLQAEIDKTQQKIQLLGGIVSLSGAATIDVLRGITEKIPATLKIDIDEYMVEPDAVRIRGKTDSFEAVDAIKQQLVGLPYFQDVQVKDAKQGPDGKEVTFRLILSISKDTSRGQ